MHRVLCAAVFALAALLACPAGAAAAPEPAAAPEETEPEALPLERIASAAASLEETLRRALDEAPSADRIAQIAEALGQLDKRTGERLALAQDALDEGASVMVLRERQVMLGSVADRLAEWATELDRASARLATSLETLEEQTEVWRLTQKSAAAAGVGAEVAQRITLSLRSIREVRTTLDQRRTQVLSLRERLLVVSSSVDETRRALQEALEGGLMSSLQARQPVLGSAAFRAALREEIREPTDLGTRLEDAVRYSREEAESLAALLALFLGLSGAFAYVRRTARQRAQQEFGLEDAGRVWERPFAMALLLTVLLVPAIAPMSPPLFWIAALALSFLSAAWVLRALADDRFDAGFAALAGLFVIDALRHLSAPVPSLGRIVLLVELLFALTAILWFARPRPLAALATGTGSLRYELLVLAGRAAVVALTIAAAAEVLGWHATAEVIGGGVLRAIYFGVVLGAAAQVVTSLVTYALSARPLRSLRTVQLHRSYLRRGAASLISWVAIASWAYLSLEGLGVLHPLWRTAAALLGGKIEVGLVAFSLGDVLLFFAVATGSYYLARTISFVLDEEIFPRVRLPRGIPYALSSLVRYVVIFVGFLFALAAAGFQLDRVALMAGGLGVGIGLGLQSVVNNFVSGLILLFERPVQVGDSVQIAADSLFGRILRIGMRSTVIRSFEGSEVIVPNADLTTSAVTNWTLSDRHRRMELRVGVAYGSDPRRVLELLTTSAASVPEVLSEPAPQAFFTGFGDSSLDFMLRIWVRDFDVGFEALSGTALAVHDALDRAGIEIPFPQRDLHLKSTPAS